MKKTITSLALALSAANASAFINPHPPGPPRPAPVLKTVCLEQYNQTEDGSLNAGDCDASVKNHLFERKLMENGCAENQVAIKTFKLNMKSCPTAVQL